MLKLLEDLSPHARVLTAVAPFVLAMALRLILGKNGLTKMLISAGTIWFVVNVLMAPYSPRMRQDIEQLRYMIR